jgi:hypothetical protein
MATNSYQNDMQLKLETQSILHRQKQNTTGAVLSCHNSLNEIFGLILYDRLFSCVFVAMTVHHFPPVEAFGSCAHCNYRAVSSRVVNRISRLKAHQVKATMFVLSFPLAGTRQIKQNKFPDCKKEKLCLFDKKMVRANAL